MTEPYVKRDPGDVIRSGDWNDIQIKAREELHAEVHSHRHTGDDGLKIPREGIEARAIDGSLIDPVASVVLDSLTVDRELKVNGKAILGDIDDLQGEIKKLENEKVNRSGDTITGVLKIDQQLTVGGKIEAGNSDMYFTNTTHDHTGFGNTEGYAAIENAENHEALMILGRATRASGHLKRIVKLWDFLQVNGDLEVTGSVIRRVAVATGRGPDDGTDNGQIKSRVLKFNKAHADTAVRIFYSDNFRVLGNNVAATWEIRVNGIAPPGGAIFQVIYDEVLGAGRINTHGPGSILGYATGLSAGEHEIQIWVGPPHTGHNHGDVYTGWPASRWTIEAEEVRI